MDVMTRALGGSLGNPNYQGPFGNTLLHGAVVSGDLREVRRLLAAGADPRIANRDGKTPVQAAAILGYAKIQDVLRKAKPLRR
jgi:ankyrin repeat protein